MVLPAPRSGCALEGVGNGARRQMIVLDRTRLTGPLRDLVLQGPEAPCIGLPWP